MRREGYAFFKVSSWSGEVICVAGFQACFLFSSGILPILADASALKSIKGVNSQGLYLLGLFEDGSVPSVLCDHHGSVRREAVVAM